MRRLVLIALLCVSSLAHADDSARDHFQRGQSLYDSTRYEAALHEFEAAQALQPMPALVYDIARCLEKLGRNDEAAAAYQSYLDDGGSENIEEIHTRLAELRKQPEIVQSTRVEVAPTPRRQPYVTPGAVMGGALALGVIGAGLLGSAAHDFNVLRSSCSPACATSSWTSLPVREHTGEALLGIAGVVAVVDVVLWVRTARRHR